MSKLNLTKNIEIRTKKTTAQNNRLIAGIEELLHKKEQVNSLFTRGIFLYADLILIPLPMTII